MTRRSKKQYALNFGGMVSKFVKAAAPFIVFAQQLTEKDMAILPDNRSYTQQGKDALNILTGRMAGFHLFNAASDYKPPFTTNVAGIANKWTGLSLGMMIYGAIAKKTKFLPKGRYMLSLGKRMLPAAVVGGFFDAPTGQATNGGSGGYVAPKAPELQNRSTQSNYIPQYNYIHNQNTGMGGI